MEQDGRGGKKSGMCEMKLGGLARTDRGSAWAKETLKSDGQGWRRQVPAAEPRRKWERGTELKKKETEGGIEGVPMLGHRIQVMRHSALLERHS